MNRTEIDEELIDDVSMISEVEHDPANCYVWMLPGLTKQQLCEFKEGVLQQAELQGTHIAIPHVAEIIETGSVDEFIDALEEIQ